MAKHRLKFEVRPSRPAACIRLADDINAGVLLYCVYLRFNKNWSQLKRDGKSFIAMTGKELQHYTGFTRHRHDRAIKILKEKKLIIVEHHKVRKSDKFQRTWIHLPDSTVSAMAEIMEMPIDSVTVKKEVEIDSVTMGCEAVIDSAVSEHNINDNKKENEEINNDVLEENKYGLKDINNKKDIEGGSNKGVVKKKVTELNKKELEGLLEDIYKSVDDSPEFPEAYNINALKTCLLYFSKMGLPMLNGDFVTQYPESRAIELIFQNWMQFMKKAKSNGAFGKEIPKRPNIQWLRLQIPTAGDFIKDKTKELSYEEGCEVNEAEQLAKFGVK